MQNNKKWVAEVVISLQLEIPVTAKNEARARRTVKEKLIDKHKLPSKSITIVGLEDPATRETAKKK